jgi:hypothetical protein
MKNQGFARLSFGTFAPLPMWFMVIFSITRSSCLLAFSRNLHNPAIFANRGVPLPRALYAIRNSTILKEFSSKA